ncbi:MAG: glycosyltransferase [Rhodospirillales bacterium]|nr:glycosyltransferase [Rhodospirillales bacterium]
MTASKSGRRTGKPARLRGSPAALPDMAAAELASPPPAAAPAIPAPAPAAPFAGLIELDPNLTAGFAYDRFDILLRGRILSPVAISEIAVYADDLLVGRNHFAADAAVTRAVLPDGTRGRQYSFAASVMRPAEEADGRFPILLSARGADGHTISAPFEITIDPAGDQIARITAGAMRSASTYPNAHPAVLLLAERAVLDDHGFLLVHGWAVALRGLAAIDVFVDEERVGSATIGLPRGDIGALFPMYPGSGNAGFSLSLAIAPRGPDLAFARIEARDADGGRQDISLVLERSRNLGLARPSTPRSAAPTPSAQNDADAALPDPRRAVHLFSDAAAIARDGQVVVHGWAACAIGIRAIEILLNDTPIGQAELGLPRPDVGAEYPDIPMAAQAGFRFHAQCAPPGDREMHIRVIARNPLDDIRAEDHRAPPVDTAPPLPAASTPADAAPPPPEPGDEFRFELDSPALSGDAASQPVTGRLTIDGWILARSGVVAMDVLLDDALVGQAHLGLARQDVGVAFPDWPNALRSGYAFHFPPRSLRNGSHAVTLRARAANGAEAVRQFRIDVRKPEQEGDGLGIRRQIGLVERQTWARVLQRLGRDTAFRFVIAEPRQPDPALWAATLASLRTQIAVSWRVLAIAGNKQAHAALAVLFAEQAGDLASRIDLITATDAAARAPFGTDRDGAADELYCFLAAGDEAGADALAEYTLAHGLHPDAELLYADEVRISPASGEREPFCKPDFSPDLLLSTNYIGRLWCATPTLLRRAKTSPAEYLQRGSYDLVLRASEVAAAIHHIPRLLCRRGPREASAEQEQEALARTAARRSEMADAVPTAVPGTWRYQRLAPVSGLVSIIIPTCGAHGHIETCINTLRSRTAYANIEIIVIDNIPSEALHWKMWVADHADVVVEIPEAFNWSRFNNRAAEFASGEYLLFLNDDIEITQEDWLHTLLEHAARPEVGVVGPQLLYPAGTVQHAGMFLAGGGVARHAFRFAAADEPGYFGLALTQRNVIAVTGACMLMRRAVFDQLQGFDEAHQVINNDLDFCLRVHEAGLAAIFTPYASLIHHELASRDRIAEIFDLSHFNSRWRGLFQAGDPYFSPLLSRNADDYRPEDEPTEILHAGNPRFATEEIRAILVMKLDHIGDFITALPAIRALKARFPQAKLHVLASRGARPFATIETAVDGFIEFEFFHARSGLGQKALEEADFKALGETLRPYGFDLAVDLRKHPDTREVLRHIPARFRAGFDQSGQFPFLDIALEWETDRNLQRKHTHVSEDLMNLVATIGTAAEPARTTITLPARADATRRGFLPEHLRHLLDRPLIAIHPGVGSIMRQWPAGHFAALIDLLLARHDANIALIGGPDEAELAEEVLSLTAAAERVTSLAGAIPLADLPYLLAACALYVGNNSGPKHIAAAIGVPTIGIHSGVVDAREWAPLGVEAVAVQRQMTCFPCYLARPEDCPRGVACLTGLSPAEVARIADMMLARPLGRHAAVGAAILVQPTADKAGADTPGVGKTGGAKRARAGAAAKNALATPPSAGRKATPRRAAPEEAASALPRASRRAARPASR